MCLSKRTLTYCLLLAGLGAATGCSDPKPEPGLNLPPPSVSAPDTATPGESGWPYEFVSTKSERTGFYNVSDLYAFSGDLDVENLKAFCRDRYRQTDAEGFYYVVVFDAAENAGFPSNPLTAGYSLDEGLATHVRAVCEFNKANGFAELRHYAENSYVSVASVERL